MTSYPLADPGLLAQVADDLIEKGWQPVWCPERQNGACTPSVNPSVTGYDAPYPTNLPQPPGPHRLGFRVPPHLVIIDVDHYEGKQGAHTLDRAEEYLGPLPPTYKVTARGLDDPSGRFIYRKPVDLDFSNSALNQFANENGKTDIDILRTGHRFSWAPGDLNHKNHKPVKCYDPDGVVCLMPYVDDPSIPELPERWTDYLRKPPAAFSTDSYTRPADGPQWWLQQPDESLSTDDALKSFAFSMMVSRVPVEEIYPQWLRVSHSDDPSWPWDREDFDRHTRPQAQQKAYEVIAREEAQLDALPASRDQLDYKEREGFEQRERDAKLAALRDQRIQEAITRQNLFPAQPIDVDEPQRPAQTFSEYVRELVRGYPEFTAEFKRELVRGQAKADVAELLAAPFTGYRTVAHLPEPPDPETLYITGKDSPGTRVIARAKVTVISGHRSSGKTWVTAAWAAQELRAGNVVIWIDFERQDAQLASKLRQLGIQEHMLDAQLRYTPVLPPAATLVKDVQEAGAGGAHRVLVVVDAFRALQNRVMPGTTANDGDAVEQVYSEYLTPVAEAGANIVLLDHMAKATSGNLAQTTFGSERKESAADYVIRVEKVMPFSKKTSGFSSLTLTKARGGHEDEGAPVGFLWVPSDTEDTSDRGITRYPKVPELRNWAPEAVMTLDDTATGQSDKAQREIAVIETVRERRLQFGARELGRHLNDVYPELFRTPKAATDFAARMCKDGKITREEGRQGKYDLPDQTVPLEVREVPPEIDPSVLEHSDA